LCICKNLNVPTMHARSCRLALCSIVHPTADVTVTSLYHYAGVYTVIKSSQQIVNFHVDQ